VKKWAAKCRFAAVIEVLENRRLLSGTPQDVVLANQLVSNITASNNNYSYGTPVVSIQGVNGASTYNNSSDCSTFQTLLLEQAYGFTPSQFSTWTGSTLPQSVDLYNAALHDDGCTGFYQIADLQMGDEMFINYLTSDAQGDTGHCVMVDALPTPDAAYTTATQKAYDLTVVDCTSDPHTDDTRMNGETGVGRGKIRIYTNLAGNLTSYSWGLSSQSVVYNDTQRESIFAKVPAAAGNSFLAAGSQATWNSSNDVLTVTGPAALIADPGSGQQPVVTISGSGTQLLMMPGTNSVIHLASLTMTNNATAAVNDPNSGHLLLDIAANVGNGIISVDSTSQLDMTGNDILIHGGSLSSINSLIARGFNGGKWNGNGLTSSLAASNSAHLTALGAIQNSNGTTAIYSTFDGFLSNTTDVLVRYTYYGDANLDGKIDGSDYSLIDNGYEHRSTLTGWYNGDFNYDGSINGTDYTLIDNAFNTQGSQFVSNTSQIAPATITRTVAVVIPTEQNAVSSTDMLKKNKHFSQISRVISELTGT
jgi:hypothetical protein